MERATLGTRVALAISLVGWTGCMLAPPMTIAVPARFGSDPNATGSFRAGAARVDITPIPGVPLGGYSIDGKASRGFWSRLYARALYLEDANATPLVMISTDLGAIPGGLGDEVTRLLHQKHGLTWIGREHVLLAATHTHHGPGNFYTNQMFNQTISPWPGFDESLFHFLAGRIAVSVAQARLAARPAELLATDATALEASKDWKLDQGFFRNRSLGAFLLNPKAREHLDGDLVGCPLWPDDPETLENEADGRACLAVRPQVELLAIRHTGGTGAFVGVAAFLAVHPTALPPRLEVYSSDLFGVADVQLERRGSCGKLVADPVVAFFNGAEGDVSPTWSLRNREEVLDLGEELASKVCELLDHLKPVVTDIDFRHAWIDLPAQPFTEKAAFLDSMGNLADRERRTANWDLPGGPAVGGAEDGRSILYKLLGHREKKTLVARRPTHGPKSPVGYVEAMGLGGNPLRPIMWLWNGLPPRRVPIGVYRVGSSAPNVVIVAVPGELTTRMGTRVREAVWEKLRPPKPAKPEHVLLVGLANEYVGYFTTPEEYDAQDYEGAMTLYGPASGPFLAQELAALAALDKSKPELPTAWLSHYRPGGKEEFHPKHVSGAPYLKDDGLADLLTHDLTSAAYVRRDLPVFCWRDKVPRLEAVAPDCSRSNPEVEVERRSTATGSNWQPVGDNFAGDLITVVTGVGKHAGRYHTDWCAIWLGAPEYLEPVRAHDFRFTVKPLVDLSSGLDLESAHFQLLDTDNDNWADDRFLQHPAPALEPDFPCCELPASDQCTVPQAP